MHSSEFVHIDSPETEQCVLKKYATLQNFLRSRGREDKLNEFDIREKSEKLFAPIIESTNRIGQRIDIDNNNNNNNNNSNNNDGKNVNDDNVVKN